MLQQLQSIAIQAQADLVGAFTLVVGAPDAAYRLSVASQVGKGIRIRAPQVLHVSEQRTFSRGEFRLTAPTFRRHRKNFGSRALIALVGGGRGANLFSLDVQTVRTKPPARQHGWLP